MKLETFLEKFDRIADAPDSVAKMRELVRHLAVAGTLVDQDRNDEPALVLLDRIAAHKAALAGEGRLRGPTTVAPMSPDEGTRLLPSSWTWVRFGEIMVNRDGERIPVSEEERASKAKTYDYYGASGVIDKIDGYLFDKPLLLIGEDGANLINRSTPIAFMARGKYWVNNHAHVLDGISEDFLRFIELHINAINLEPYVTGSAQPKMNQAKMNSIPIALPPLAEQKRIVAKVDELMALCDRLAAQQQEREARHTALTRASLVRFADAPTPANLNFIFHPSYDISPADLRKSILTLAVQGKLVPQDPNDEPAQEEVKRIRSEKARLVAQGELKRERPIPKTDNPAHPYDLPNGWCWSQLGDLSLTVTSGSRDWAAHYASEGAIFVRMGNLSRNSYRLRLDKIQRVAPPSNAEGARTRLEAGDILISITGEVGLLGLIPDGFGEAYINQHTCLVRLPRELQNRFIAEFFRSPFAQEHFNAPQRGLKNSFRLTDVTTLPTPLPPLAEQRRIVAKVDQLMALVDQLETQHTASRTVAEKLMQAVVAELTEFA